MTTTKEIKETEETPIKTKVKVEINLGNEDKAKINADALRVFSGENDYAAWAIKLADIIEGKN